MQNILKELLSVFQKQDHIHEVKGNNNLDVFGNGTVGDFTQPEKMDILPQQIIAFKTKEEKADDVIDADREVWRCWI